MAETKQKILIDGILIRFHPVSGLIFVRTGPGEVAWSIHKLLRKNWFKTPIRGIVFEDDEVPMLVCGNLLNTYMETALQEKEAAPEPSFKDLL